MAKTTAQAFADFEAKLRLTDAQKDKVVARRERAEAFLKEAFPSSSDTPLKSAKLMGSAARDTAIRPLGDIDVHAIFENKDQVFEKYRYDSQAFLHMLTRKIKAKTSVRQVGSKGQAVRLEYTDGLHVDIAPTFTWSGSGYALPAGDKTWITTNPYTQATWAANRQVALKSNFKHRVRLLKRWNSEHPTSSLSSWHLEVMVGEIFTSMSSNHRNGLERFFEWAPNNLHVSDPDGHGGDLAAGLTASQIANQKSLFKSSAERAAKALAAESAGNHEEAIRLWGIVLGNEFPSFG